MALTNFSQCVGNISRRLTQGRGKPPKPTPARVQQQCRTQPKHSPASAVPFRARQSRTNPGAEGRSPGGSQHPPGQAGPRAAPHRPHARSAPSRSRNYNSQHTPGPDKRRGRSPRRFLIDVRGGHSAGRGIAVPPMAGERRRALLYAAAGPGAEGECCRPGGSVGGVGAAPGSGTGACGLALPF